MKNRLVSVIVPTKNSEATIGICLASIKSQTYGNIEIIVVDAFSKDKTREIVDSFGVRVIESKASMSEARNIGIEQATGDLILSLDSDMELTNKVVEECINKVKSGYDAVVIPEVSVGSGFWAKCKALEKSCYLDDELIESSRFFKRDVLMKLKGYDPELEFGEDKDIDLRIRLDEYRIGRVKAFIKHNEGILRLQKMIEKKYQYGKTLGQYAKKHPRELKQQLKIARPAFKKNWRKLARDPQHALGIICLKACELGALELGSISCHRVRE